MAHMVAIVPCSCDLASLAGACGTRKIYLRRTPRPVIVIIRDNQVYSRALLYSYYATITGWRFLLRYL